MIEIDIEMASRCLTYKPKTGELVWKKRPASHFKTQRAASIWNARFPGKVAGNKERAGSTWVIRVKLNGRRYKAHRIAWALKTKSQPPEEIDHENRDATDNRWVNLRDGSLLNHANKSLQSNNTSGACGVRRNNKTGKWVARATKTIDGKKRYFWIGAFDTLNEAKKASKDFRNSIGFSSGHGEPQPYK